MICYPEIKPMSKTYGSLVFTSELHEEENEWQKVLSVRQYNHLIKELFRSTLMIQQM